MIVAISFRSCLADEDEANDCCYCDCCDDEYPRQLVNRLVDSPADVAEEHPCVED